MYKRYCDNFIQQRYYYSKWRLNKSRNVCCGFLPENKYLNWFEVMYISNPSASREIYSTLRHRVPDRYHLRFIQDVSQPFWLIDKWNLHSPTFIFRLHPSFILQTFYVPFKFGYTWQFTRLPVQEYWCTYIYVVQHTYVYYRLVITSVPFLHSSAVFETHFTLLYHVNNAYVILFPEFHIS